MSAHPGAVVIKVERKEREDKPATPKKRTKDQTRKNEMTRKKKRTSVPQTWVGTHNEFYEFACMKFEDFEAERLRTREKFNKLKAAYEQETGRSWAQVV